MYQILFEQNVSEQISNTWVEQSRKQSQISPPKKQMSRKIQNNAKKTTLLSFL